MKTKILKNGWLLTCIVITASVLSTSCDQETVKPTQDQVTDANEIYLNVAQAMAGALKDKEFRQLLKDEASKQFDEDYDVLYQLIKDRNLSNGYTVESLLEQHKPKQVESLSALTSQLPLLTIFIPDIENFSVTKWDVGSQIPAIAVLRPSGEQNTVLVIRPDGTTFSHSVSTEPDFPVIVLKENELVKQVSITEAKHGKSRIFGNEKFKYQRIKDLSGQTDGRFWASFGIRPLDPKIIAAYQKSVNCFNCFHRDYIYYNISPTEGILQGSYDNRFMEAITEFKFNNDAAYNAATNNWTEGILEFHFTIIIPTTSGMMSISKVIYFSRSRRFEVKPGSNDYSEAPVTIVPWEMHKYGNVWKVSAYEYDPNTTIQTSTTVISKVGTNFNLKIPIEKVDVGFGGSFSKDVSGTITITTATGSNDLGEALLDVNSPIITTYNTNGTDSKGTTFDLNTGALTISIEPIRIQ